MQLIVCLLAVFVVVTSMGEVVARFLAPSVGASMRSTGFSAAWLVSPFLAAFSVCSALVSPGVFSASCHCVAHGLHHPHLCVHHPSYAAAGLWPAAVVVVAWACLTLPKLGSLVSSWWQTEQWVRSLSHAPLQVLDGVSFRLIDAPGLGACTTGLFKPMIAVDAGLWRALSHDERCAVLHHEEAHRRRRDPLSMLLLRGCASLAVLSNAPELLRRWQARAEAECDGYAAEVVGAPEVVASALLALGRYHRAEPRSPVSLVVGAAGSQLEARIRGLLEVDRVSTRPNLVSDAFVVLLAGLAVVIAVTVFGGDFVHHGAETVLGWFADHP